MSGHKSDIIALAIAIFIVIAIAFVGKPLLSGGTILPPSQSGGDIGGSGGVVGGVTAAPTTVGTSEPIVVIANYSSYVTPKDQQKAILADKIKWAFEYYLPAVRQYAAKIIPDEHESDQFSILQACDIYDAVKKDWTAVGKANGIWDITPASTLINTELSGDSNDFAILVASLIKSAGGQARLKTDSSLTSYEVTYAEFFLGSSDDATTTVIDREALEAMRSSSPEIFVNDPYGRNFFRHEYASSCAEGSCTYYLRPLCEVLSEPEKYATLLYSYPELIDYLIQYPETSVVEMQMLYVKYRYGYYDSFSMTTEALREVGYTYELENNGVKSYWLRMDLSGRYPGDKSTGTSGYATAFYSDGAYKDVRFNTRYA